MCRASQWRAVCSSWMRRLLRCCKHRFSQPVLPPGCSLLFSLIATHKPSQSEKPPSSQHATPSCLVAPALLATWKLFEYLFFQCLLCHACPGYRRLGIVNVDTDICSGALTAAMLMFDYLALQYCSTELYHLCCLLAGPEIWWIHY